MASIFLDESGQFSTRADGRFFVVGSFTVGNPRRTEKQFRSWQRSKFPRRMRHQAEVKFSEVSITEELRLKTIKFIASLDVRIRYVFLEKKNIPFAYWKKGRLMSGHLYTDVIGDTLGSYLPTGELAFRAFCDERHLHGVKKSQFKSIVAARLAPRLPLGAIVQIEMVDSATNANIQIADWITGAIAHYLEGKPLGNAYWRLLQNNLLSGIELFRPIDVEDSR